MRPTRRQRSVIVKTLRVPTVEFRRMPWTPASIKIWRRWRRAHFVPAAIEVARPTRRQRTVIASILDARPSNSGACRGPRPASKYGGGGGGPISSQPPSSSAAGAAAADGHRQHTHSADRRDPARSFGGPLASKRGHGGGDWSPLRCRSERGRGGKGRSALPASCCGLFSSGPGGNGSSQLSSLGGAVMRRSPLG